MASYNIKIAGYDRALPFVNDTSAAVPRQQLSARVSASLDTARASAACYVILHHLAQNRGWDSGSFGFLFRFGQEAVLVFFLLSGFVIFANEQHRVSRPRNYYLRRLRRIYPPLLATLLISSLVFMDNGEFLERFYWQDLLGTLVSLQDISALKPGVIANPYLSNTSLWSLSYEVIFYVLFPPVWRLWKNYPLCANHCIGLACCLAYGLYLALPNHVCLVLAYFLVWWCGAMVANAYLQGHKSVLALGSLLFWLSALIGLAALGVSIAPYNGPGLYPVLMLRHFTMAFFLLVILFSPLGVKMASACQIMPQTAAAIASISYGLYVLHIPLLIQWHRAATELSLCMTIALLIAAACLVDRGFKHWLPQPPAD